MKPVRAIIQQQLQRYMPFIEHTIIHRHGLLGEKLGKRVYGRLFANQDQNVIAHELCRHLNWSRQEIEAYQTQRLRTLITHAYYQVPFYRQFYDAHQFCPEMFNSLDDISKVPVVQKSDLQRAIREQKIISKRHHGKPYVMCETTGSTGTPTQVYFSLEEDTYKQALSLRSLMLNDITPGTKTALLWRNKPVDRMFLQSFLCGHFMRFSVADTLHLSQAALHHEKLNALLHQLELFSPHILRGYSQAIYLLAKHYAKQKHRFNLKIQKIIGAAEYLPPGHWDFISDVFGAEIVHLYGGTEASNIACSTKESKDMMLFEDAYHIDLLPLPNTQETGAVESSTGRVIVSNLYCEYMPLIRYDLGDIATFGSSFLGFKTLSQVKGRSNDVITLPRARFVLADAWYHWFKMPWINRFRVTQQDFDHLIIDIETNDMISSETEAHDLLLKKMSQALGSDIRIEIRLSKHLTQNQGSKWKHVISMVPDIEKNRSLS